MRGIEELSRLLDREEIRSLEKELGGAIQKKLEKSGIYFRIFARVKELSLIHIFISYGTSSFPTTFMIDKDGNVFGYASGQLSEDMMRSIIRQTEEGKRE